MSQARPAKGGHRNGPNPADASGENVPAERPANGPSGPGGPGGPRTPRRVFLHACHQKRCATPNPLLRPIGARKSGMAQARRRRRRTGPAGRPPGSWFLQASPGSSFGLLRAPSGPFRLHGFIQALRAPCSQAPLGCFASPRPGASGPCPLSPHHLLVPLYSVAHGPRSAMHARRAGLHAALPTRQAAWAVVRWSVSSVPRKRGRGSLSSRELTTWTSVDSK